MGRWAPVACGILLAWVALAATASVAPAPDTPPTIEDAQQLAQDAHATSKSTAQDLRQAGSGMVPAPDADPEEQGEATPGNAPGSPGGQSAPPSGGHGPKQATDPHHPAPDVLVLPEPVVEGTATVLRPVRGLVPEALGVAREAAETASRLPNELLAPAPVEEAPAEEMVPATTGAEVAAPSMLAPALILAAGAATATFLGFWLAGSSGAVGANAAAAGSRVGDLRRLLPFASPLFTRFERGTVLGHPRREALYALILQEPGISLQSLGDATGLSRTAVIHHLRLMEQQHLVVSRRVGRSRHYFENGGRYGHDQKEAYALLRNDRSKAVAEFIRAHPGSMQKALCTALGIQPSIAHWHVRRLEEAQVVQTVRKGRTVAYFPGPGFAAMDPSVTAQSAPAATA